MKSRSIFGGVFIHVIIAWSMDLLSITLFSNMLYNEIDKSTKKYTLIISTLASFITPFMASSINIALPSIGKEFEMNAVLLGWVATSYILAAAIFLVPFGRIGDIYGRKKVFIYGIFIYSVSCILASISNSSFIFIFSRILQGLGGAMIFGTSLAILTSVYPPMERGKVLGINVAAVYTGLSLGPTLGGILTQTFGWRSIFLFNAPLGLSLIPFTIWKLKGEWAGARGEKFDYMGSIIYSLMLISMIYGFTKLPSSRGLLLILGGIAGLIAFILWESKSKNPVLNIKLFKNNKSFALSNLAALINYSATSAVTFLLSLYLQYIKGLSPQYAGLVLLAQPVTMAVFSPLAGRLSDKIEPGIVASIGMSLGTIGLILLVFLGKNTSLGFIIGGLIFLGFGFGLFSSPNTNGVMSSVNREFYGVASGILGTMRLVGQMFSMGMVMLIFALYIGPVKITPEYYPLFLKSSKVIFIMFSTLCFAGIFASIGRGKVRQKLP